MAGPTNQIDITLPGGRSVRAYDVPPPGDVRATVMWHHGSPQLGWPPAPLVEAGAPLGIRWVGYDRPGYGATGAIHDRSVTDVVGDVEAVLDRLGVARLTMLGSSGGGPHALACAARLSGRVDGAVCVSGLAPFQADGLDWFDGMHPAGAAELRAATSGRDALVAHLQADEFDESQFTDADHEAIRGRWHSLAQAVGAAMEAGGLAGLVADDLAFVQPWGFDVAEVDVPTVVVHGDEDRIVPIGHGRWLAAHLPQAQLVVRPGDGHVSALDGAVDVLGRVAGGW